MEMVRSIVFVCTGNTCRSPMAEVMLQAMLDEHDLPIRVESAGTHAEEGAHAAQSAQDVMEEEGLDLRGHRARPVRDDLVAAADLVLTMTRAHRDMVVGAYPEAADKTFTLKGFVGEDGDVADPVGFGLETYRATAGQLDRTLRAVVAKLMQDFVRT